MSTSMSRTEDAEAREWRNLTRAAGGGDRQAVDGLLERARPRLLRMALAFGAPPDDVPDLVQEVLLAAWRNLADLDPNKGTFLAWVARGLHGRVANLRRGSGRRSHFIDRWRGEHGDQEALAERPHGAVDARMTLAKLLRCLSSRQRDVVALYELGGLSGKETSDVLGISEAAVRSIARDARKALSRQADGRHTNIERIAS